MTDKRILPSAVPSIYDIEKSLLGIGLTYDDIITLIQNRMPGNPAKRDIKATLKALKAIEKDLREKGVIK